jgi:type VI secretion system secreted protein Hcp
MGAVEYFLKIDGIEGESADAKHRGEIDVRAWNFGENREGESQTGGGTGGGKAKFQDFYFSAKMSKATPKLIAACANGQQIKSAVLTCRKVGEFQLEFLVYKFSEILITSFQTGALEESDILPVDHVSFSFEKIEVDYVEQKSDGTLALPVSVVVQV